MTLEFPHCGQAQGEGVDVDDVAQASRPAQAQSALTTVEVGSPEVVELSGEEGVDGDEGHYEAVAGVVEAVQEAGDAVGGKPGRHRSVAGEGDSAGGIAEGEAFSLEFLVKKSIEYGEPVHCVARTIATREDGTTACPSLRYRHLLHKVTGRTVAELGFTLPAPCAAGRSMEGDGEDMRRLTMLLGTGAAVLAVVRLAVRPGWQGHGIGTRIRQALLDAMRPQWVSLLAMPGAPAQNLYRQLGYQYAGPYKTGPNGPVLDLLLLRLSP